MSEPCAHVCRASESLSLARSLARSLFLFLSLSPPPALSLSKLQVHLHACMAAFARIHICLTDSLSA